MRMRLNARAGRPATRSAIGCAARARRTHSSPHRPPHRAERRAAAHPTAAAHAPVIGRRRAPVHAVPR